MVRQDWGRFKLDRVFPMLYHTFYEEGPEWVRRYTEEAVRAQPGRVYSGLFVSPLTDAELARTIEMALGGGAHGRVDLRRRRDESRALEGVRLAVGRDDTRAARVVCALIVLFCATSRQQAASASQGLRAYLRASSAPAIDGRSTRSPGERDLVRSFRRYRGRRQARPRTRRA
jgi:hypothetical protein